MAANSSDRQREPDGLKYLGFFHVAAQKAISRVRSVYNYGKDNSGALKQGIEAVEGAVEVLVSPLYQKIQGKPFEILSYADQKVDDSIATVESKVPTSVKSTAKHVY